MTPADVGLWVMIAKGIYDLGSYIRERRQARLAARRRQSKPCPPPVPKHARTGAKQAPRQDGKR